MVRRTNPSLPIRAEIAEVEQPGIDGQPGPVVQLVPYDNRPETQPAGPPVRHRGPGLRRRSRRPFRARHASPASRCAPTATCRGTRRTRRSGRSLPNPARPRRRGHPRTRSSRTWRAASNCCSNCAPTPSPLPSNGRRAAPCASARSSPASCACRSARTATGSASTAPSRSMTTRCWKCASCSNASTRPRAASSPLGDGRFVALTRQLQAQLQRLTAVSEPHRNGRRVHALGAPALDAVLEEAGEVKSDAAWKKHVARIRAAEGWTPDAAGNAAGRTARLPGRGLRLDVPPRALGRRRLPRRRHGPGQDGAGDRRHARPGRAGALPGRRPHLGLSQLGSTRSPASPPPCAPTGWSATGPR